MDWLEATKKAHHENEAITNDIAAQAHIENWALKLFLYADKNDRASNFGKNVIQSFYTAGLLYDVLMTFGDLSEEAGQNRKYAKWKAAYIHNCLKNGETPVPGPIKDENDDSNESNGNNLGKLKKNNLLIY
jgi:vacuolar protein sorting-associated protein VTA1